MREWLRIKHATRIFIKGVQRCIHVHTVTKPSSSTPIAIIMRLLWVLVGTVGCAAAVVKRSGLSFDYNKDKIRGVNLGGWLLLEPWITPSLFQQFTGQSDPAVDERSFCEKLGAAEAQAQLTAHWSSFITAQDFADLASIGINHVRIPIGYWAFISLPSDPFVPGAGDYLTRAIGWAQQYGIKVWVDLHGAPGSQNGFDNSGWRGQLQWQKGSNVGYTLQAMQVIASRYATPAYAATVTAIELVNEPLGPQLDMGGVKGYYWNGYNTVRGRGDTGVCIHDAFQTVSYWDNFMSTSSGAYNSFLDTHQYQVFTDGQLWQDLSSHIGTSCSIGQALASATFWTAVGEFSGAMTDCAQWLNGFNTGSRWEAQFEGASYHGSCSEHGSISTWSDSLRQDTTKYIEAQFDAFDQGVGWFFWTWKTEGGDDAWSFQNLQASGIIPFPLTTRRYYNQCGY